jgi:hypothetical protein
MRLRAVLLLPLTAVLLLVGAPVAVAGADPAAYPVSVCATISTSTTNPLPGQSIVIIGNNFDPNASVRLVLDTGAVLGRVTTDANGHFRTSVRMPASATNTGMHKIYAKGGTTDQPANCPTDPVQTVTIQASSSEPGGSGGNSGGGTAFTGVDVLGLLAGAAVLILAGVGLNRRGRSAKRRATQAS